MMTVPFGIFTFREWGLSRGIINYNSSSIKQSTAT